VKSAPATFACGDIQLEGAWHLPETASPTPAVVVCHPHPLYGGSMDNNVVEAICQALAEQSIAAFRFNFRGVGRSEGTFGDGIAEQEDIKSALSMAASTSGIDPEKIGLTGYSFGAGVAAPAAAQDSRVKLLALVSPALSDPDWAQLKHYKIPRFLISGEHDFVIPAAQFRQHLNDTAEPKQGEVIPGADHFWQGYEDELSRKVAQFFVAGFS